MVPCTTEVLQTSSWQGLPRRTAETLCPSTHWTRCTLPSGSKRGQAH